MKEFFLMMRIRHISHPGIDQANIPLLLQALIRLSRPKPRQSLVLSPECSGLQFGITLPRQSVSTGLFTSLFGSFLESKNCNQNCIREKCARRTKRTISTKEVKNIEILLTSNRISVLEFSQDHIFY